MMQHRQSLRESLSAAVDGEAPELELRRVLNAVGQDAEMGRKWERLHLIGNVIRSEALSRHNEPSRPWLAEAAGASAVADEPPRLSRWLGPLTGVAAAAAAALVVVLYFGGAGGEAVPQASANALADAAAPARGLAQVPTERDLQRANSYLLQHAQHTSIAARPVALPLVKFTTDDDRRLAVPEASALGNERQ